MRVWEAVLQTSSAVAEIDKTSTTAEVLQTFSTAAYAVVFAWGVWKIWTVVVPSLAVRIDKDIPDYSYPSNRTFVQNWTMSDTSNTTTVFKEFEPGRRKPVDPDRPKRPHRSTRQASNHPKHSKVQYANANHDKTKQRLHARKNKRMNFG